MVVVLSSLSFRLEITVEFVGLDLIPKAPIVLKTKLIRELRKFKGTVATKQETKWFGQDVWSTDEFSSLHLDTLYLVMTGY